MDSFVTPWTVAHQTPLSMGFPRKKYWNGLSFPSSGDLLDPGFESVAPVLAGRFFTTWATWEAPWMWFTCQKFPGAQVIRLFRNCVHSCRFWGLCFIWDAKDFLIFKEAYQDHCHGEFCMSTWLDPGMPRLFLGASVRVSLELAFDIGGRRKVDFPPQFRWALSSLGRHE